MLRLKKYPQQWQPPAPPLPKQYGPTEMMEDSLYCTCGGQYQHVDTDIDNGKVTDSYQCDGCETWCIIIWDKATEQEIERRYEEIKPTGPAATQEQQMTTQEKFNQLTTEQQKRINREVSEIIYAGQNAFYLDTGLQASERRNYWAVVAYAMGEK